MPELPDVEVYKRYIQSTALHKNISDIEIKADRVVNDDSRILRKSLKDKQFIDTYRHGKYLFLDYGEGWLMMHFGMSGKLKYFKQTPEDTDHHRVVFHFDNDYSLAYVSRRMLGEIELVDRPEDYTKENLIGPDAYSLSKDEFYEKILTKKGMIKTALMDQSLISGIGNVYSDEILFHAKIHPKRKASDLRKKDIDHIYDKMQYVFQGAIEGNVEEFPGDFLIPRREEGLACPKCGGDIKKQKVGGRSAYICSKCQCL